MRKVLLFTKNNVKTTKFQNIWERVDPIPLFTAIPVLKYILILFIILLVLAPLATFSRYIFHYRILIVIIPLQANISAPLSGSGILPWYYDKEVTFKDMNWMEFWHGIQNWMRSNIKKIYIYKKVALSKKFAPMPR